MLLVGRQIKEVSLQDRGRRNLADPQPTVSEGTGKVRLPLRGGNAFPWLGFCTNTRVFTDVPEGETRGKVLFKEPEEHKLADASTSFINDWGA